MIKNYLIGNKVNNSFENIQIIIKGWIAVMTAGEIMSMMTILTIGTILSSLTLLTKGG
jgi:hypothetical protein